jgi:hypothetical protein
MRARLLAALLVLGLGACTPTPTPTATPAPTTSKFAAAQARPTSSASPRHRCPMWVPRIDHMAPSPRLTARPADVRVCVVNEPPSKRPIPDGVTLDGRSAANLARLVHAMPVGGVPAQCSRRRRSWCCDSMPPWAPRWTCQSSIPAAPLPRCLSTVSPGAPPCPLPRCCSTSPRAGSITVQRRRISSGCHSAGPSA